MAKDAKQIRSELNQHIAAETARMAQELTWALREESPVRSGLLRDNWVPQAGQPNRRFEGKATAAQRQSDAVASLKAEPGQTVFVSNNLPYASAAIHGDAGRPPTGTVERAIDRVVKK